MLDQLPIPLTPGNQLELSGRLVLIPPEMRDGPLVGVIVDTNPMDNLHDPFLLYVALYPRGCNPRKGTRASGSLHFVYRTSRLQRLRRQPPAASRQPPAAKRDMLPAPERKVSFAHRRASNVARTAGTNSAVLFCPARK